MAKQKKVTKTRKNSRARLKKQKRVHRKLKSKKPKARKLAKKAKSKKAGRCLPQFVWGYVQDSGSGLRGQKEIFP